MPRKPCFLTKSQISLGDLALSLWRISQSSTMRQSSFGRARRGTPSPPRVSAIGRNGAQLLPVGRAGEQLGIEADGAGVERLLLGVGDLGQDALDLAGRSARSARHAGWRARDSAAEHDHRQPGEHAEEAELGHVRVAVQHARLPDEDGGSQAQRPRPTAAPAAWQARRHPQCKWRRRRVPPWCAAPSMGRPARPASDQEIQCLDAIQS